MDQTTPAQTVGNQFVSQYYTVLHSSPKHLHRFYSDRSTLTYVDVIPEGDTITQNLKTATGQKMIHETVMNLGYEDTMTEIYSVDSQYSKDGGVVVQVTGALQAKDRPKRPFVQTFFLAVQEKGYFVLNDIFRYLLPPGIANGLGAGEEEEQQDETVSSSAPMSTAEATSERAAGGSASLETDATPSPVSASPKSRQKGTPTPSPPAREPDQQPKPPQPLPAAIAGPPGAPPFIPVPPVIPPPPPAGPGVRANGVTTAPVVPIAYGVAPPPPLGVPMAIPIRPPPPRDISPATGSGQGSPGVDSQPHSAPGSARRPPPPPPRQDTSPSSGRAGAGTPTHAGSFDGLESPPTEGVFIRDIPGSVTVDQLASALSQFGPIVSNTLSLKTQRGRDSYAFVDFVNVESAAACLAQGLELEGRKLTMEPKRPLIFRQSGGPMRGGPPTQQQLQQQGGGGRGYRGGPPGAGRAMLPRGPPPAPHPAAYASLAPYPGPVIMMPQGMAMAMQMPQGMMDGAYGMAPPPGVMGRGGGRGGGRYDANMRGGGRGGGRGGHPSSMQQMPYQ